MSRRRSLRRTFAVRFAATMALALAAASAAICWAASRVLEGQLDDALEATALLSGKVLAATPDAPALGLPDDAGTSAHDGNRYVVLRDGGGRVLVALPSRAAELPLDSAALTTALTGTNAWRRDRWQGGEMRSIYTGVTRGGSDGRVVQVAGSLAPIRSMQLELVVALGAIVLFGAMATFVGAWVLAGSAVRPVAEITEQATHIEAGTLDLRIAAHADTEEYQGLVGVLNRMLERLDFAFRSQRRLAADVSHELRSPLTALRGEVEVALRSERSREDYQRVLRSALEEVDRMIALTEELLLVTRADARLIQPEREATDVNALVRRVLAGLRAPAGDKALVIEEALTAPPVAVDPGLIAQMLERLLDNAVKFTPPGGRLRVTTAPLGTGLRLAVENSGDGIGLEHLPHVFEPFFRADQARTRDTGLGLGLTVAAAIARLHGGTIGASNLPAGGARFQVDLPGPIAA